MGCHVAVPPLRLLHDHLSVENDPKAREEQSAHQVPNAECCTAHQPPNQTVHDHALDHGGDDASKEQEGPPLGEE